MKKILIFAFTFLVLLFPLFVTGCDLITPKKNIETQRALNLLIEDIEKLEEISKNFNQSNYQRRVAIFIRCKKYNTSIWNFAGGQLEDGFEDYVRENQCDKDLFYLQSKENFVDVLTEKNIDFVHTFACINLLFQGISYGDLGGWAGDLCQLVQEIKNQSSTDSFETRATEKFNGISSFGSEDVLSDIDAVNIMSIYNQSQTKSLSGSINEYYKNLTAKMRFENYKNYLFDNGNIDNKYYYIYNRMNGNIAIYGLCSSYSISLTDDKDIFDACIKVFVDYFED